jgi:branched-chain amino acid transport system substrate-binding protein
MVGPTTTRRRALLGAASVAAAPLAMPFIRNAAAAEPIRIGLLLAKQGSIVEQVEYLQQGTFMALDDINKTILGRPAEIIWEDEPSPQGAAQNAQKLIQEQKVVALLGGALSSSALAEEAVAGRLKIPFFINNAAAREITGTSCNRYTFRLNPPVPVQARAMLDYLRNIGKRWYFLTASYAFGQDIARSFKDLLKEIGGTNVGADEVPVGTSDFSSYILKIRQAKPDLVIGGVPAGDLSNFLKQWNELGMKDKIPFTEIAIGDSDLWAVGPQTATGIYTSLWWYQDPNNNPEDKAFAAAYQKKFNRPAADKAWMGWFAARTLFQAIEAAKSTEPAAIVHAMETWRGKDGKLPVYFRPWDHQLVHRMLILGIRKQIPNKWDYFDVLASAPDSEEGLAKAFGSKEESDCKMPPA